MTKRNEDDNGYITVPDNPISRSGVFDYSGAQIGAEDKTRIYKVYRSDEALSNQKTIDSFKLVPFVNEHAMLGKKGVNAEDKGVQGTTGQDVYFKDGILYATLKIFSTAVKTLIENGKKELSCGFRCNYPMQEGTYKGEHYDAIQTNIMGNHVALVEAGRMGKTIAVLDAADKCCTDLVCTFNTKEIDKMTLEELGKKYAETKLEPKAKDKKAKDEDEDEKAKDKKSKDEDEAMDMALFKKQIIADIAKRDTYAEKLSTHIGTFDHKSMDLRDVVKYGIKKLELNAMDGQEESVLSGYLAGASLSKATTAMDTKTVTTSNELDAYLKGV
jgi:hypothetical protein